MMKALKWRRVLLMLFISGMLMILHLFYSMDDPILFEREYKEKEKEHDVYHDVYHHHLFQIGFNKCGTTSLYRFFLDNEVPSVSYKLNQSNEAALTLSDIMFDRYNDGLPVLPYNGTKYVYYGDFGEYVLNGSHDLDVLFIDDDDDDENESNQNKTWYKVLSSQYASSSIFILNVRNINNWLKSRFSYPFPVFSVRSIRRNIQKYANSEYVDIVRDWRTLWYQYLCGLIAYFIDNELSDKLILFDIERDDIQKLVRFLSPFGFSLDANKYSKHRVTPKRRAWIKKWENITSTFPEFTASKRNEYQNLERECRINLDRFT